MRLSQLLVLILIGRSVEAAAPPAPANPLPVREVTVFKDGHAFVLHQGSVPTDSSGHVVLDSVPTPVMGTFWPFSAQDGVRLVSSVAGRHTATSDRGVITLPELLEVNVGAEVTVTEHGGDPYAATLIGSPRRQDPRNEAPSELVLFRTGDGVRAVGVSRIRDVTFKAPPRERTEQPQMRNRLTLALSWPGKPAPAANVGLLYVQKGVRWIPSYKVHLDGRGTAAISLQATLVNELTDLEDASVNLVVGVPAFTFKDTPDPMAVQDTFARLSRYFDDHGGRNAMSHVLMSQSASLESREPQGSGQGVAPELFDPARSEDLYVFNLPHVTLRKGERMVVPVAEYSLPYEDVFTLDLPFGAPRGVRANSGSEEAARLLAVPKVMHKIRLTNRGRHPLTTAPALLLRGERLLAQGMMTYAAVGATADVTLTAAVDIVSRRSEEEVGRTLKALRWDSDDYAKVDLTGKINLTSHRPAPVLVEVVREVAGSVDAADQGAVILKDNALEAGERTGRARSFDWPHWWWGVNSVGRITWRVTLEPGKPVDLGYSWHYYWR